MQYQRFFWRLTRLASVFAFSFSCASVSGWADVTTSGLGTTVTTSGAANNVFTIQGGTLQNSNLFHSFGEFDLTFDSTNPESAIFSNNQGGTINNVIGRITGGASTIDGDISFDGTLASANLFLINPAGLVFGSNSSISIPGSFHASTADVINFGSDVFGAATTAMDISSFSTASPTSFGFLNDASFNGITVQTGADFDLNLNQTLSLIGAGTVTDTADGNLVDDGVVIEQINTQINSGRINIASVNGAGSVSNLNSGALLVSGARGDITATGVNLFVSGLSSATPGGLDDVDGAGGEIYITGGNLSLTDSSITSELFSNTDSGNININGTGAVMLDNTRINTGHDQGFTFPEISITLPIIGTIVIFPETVIPAVVKGIGDAGDVFITGDTVAIVAGSNIFSRTEDLEGVTASGASGSVTISATSTSATDFATFSPTPENAEIVINNSSILTEASGGGQVGAISINGGVSGGFLSFFFPTILNADTIYINNSTIESLTSDSIVDVTNGSASVNINANYGVIDNSRIGSDTQGSGDAGFLALNGLEWLVRNDSKITSETKSTGNAGSITIGVDDFTLDASIISSSVTTDLASADTSVTGSAGDIFVTDTCPFFFCSFVGDNSTNSFVVQNNAKVVSITTTTDNGMQNGVLLTPNAGDAGTITIDTNALVVTGTGSQINTSTVDGAGGNISINLPTAATASVSSGGLIVSNTFGDGDAGTISFTGDGDITLLGSGATNQVESNQVRNGLGDAGDISIIGNSASFETGGRISSSTTSTATGFEIDGITPRTSDAGFITITASLVDTDGIGLSKIVSDSNLGVGDAGNITINADTLNLDLADVFANNSIGAGGLIDFNVTGTTTINGFTFIRASSSGSGAAGQIDINTDTFVLDDRSYLRSSATGGGDAGGVLINAVNSVDITNRSDIQSSAIGSGTAGAIIISANTFTLDNSQILTNNVNGAGGLIDIIATTQGDITNNVPSLGFNNQTLISSSTAGSGDAGIVDLSGATWNISGDIVPGDADGSEGLGSTVIRSTSTLSGNAGDISIDASVALNISGFAQVTSSSNASGDAGFVDLTSAAGTISLTTNAEVTSSATATGAAGLIAIDADSFTLDGAQIRTETNNLAGMETDVGAILITANTGTIQNTDSANNTVISANTTGSRTAGDIIFLGDTWNISGNAADDPMAMTNVDLSTRITSNTTSSGKAGNIAIVATGPVTISDYALLATASNGSTGDAGNILLQASNSITLDTNAQVTSNLNGGSSGNAGNIEITTENDVSETTGDTVSIQGDAIVSSSSQGGSNNIAMTGGNAGRIIIDTDIFSIIDNSEINTTNNAGSIVGGVSNNGRISITANEIGTINTTSESDDAAEIKSNTVGNGDAGQVGIFGGDWTINGTTAAGFGYPDYQAQIATNQTDMSGTFTGDAGDILVMVDTLTMQNRGKIESSTSGTAVGGMGQVSDAGNIRILADDLIMPGSSIAQIYSNATGAGVNGSAGDIDISVTNLDLNLGDIFAQNNDGPGGNITITADTASVSASTFIKTDTSGSGTAGNILFLGGDWTFDSAGNEITSEALSGATGNAGNIGTAVDTLTITGGDIATSTAAGSSGIAGNILLQAATSININGSSIDITSSTGSGSSGNAGTVTITTESTSELDDTGGDTIMVMGGARIASNSSQGSGAAGNIAIDTDNFTIDGASIRSETSTGINDDLMGTPQQRGSITINANTLGTVQATTATQTVISANTSGSGPAGDVTLNGLNWSISGNTVADSATVAAAAMAMVDPLITNFSTQITSSTNGVDGNAGQILIDITGTANINDYAQISTNTSTNGQAGAVGVFADTGVVLDTFAQLSSNTSSTGNAGKVVIQTDESNVSNTDFVTIQGGAEVSSSSSSTMMSAGGAGNVEIDTDIFTINSAEITTETSAGTGGNIEIDAVTASIENNSDITADTDGANNAGSVDIAATISLDITGGATVSSSSTDGTGEAGSVVITTANLTIDNGRITTATNTGTAALGNIDITVPVITLANNSLISADNIGGNGNAGDISLNASTSIEVNSGSTISSNSVLGAGNAGNVNLVTADLDVDNATVATVNRDGATPALITIDATSGIATATFSNNARITANTLGTGPAGDIMITAGDVLVQTGSVISSSSQSGTGSAGGVSIEAGDITIDNASVRTVNNAGADLANIVLRATNSSTGIITNGAIVTANTVGTGDAGSISLLGPNWIVSGASTRVTSSTTGAGDAGQITATTANFLLDAATISTDSSSAGDSGAILIDSGLIRLINSGTIQSNVSGTGDGGVVTLTSGSDIFLSSGAEVSTNTTPNAAPITEGDAGDIFINAVGSLNMVSSLLTSSTTSDGEAGTVTISTGDNVYLLDSTVLVDSTGATTPGVGGGDLNVTTGVLVLDGSTLDASAGSGTGGNVSITADYFFISPDSVIDVSSGSGASGTLSVNAVAVDLSGSLNALKVKFKDGGKLLRQACSTKGAANNSSSFIVENGIEGIPSSPVDFQSASTLDLIIPPSQEGKALNTSSSSSGATSPAGTALFAAIACGAF